MHIAPPSGRRGAASFLVLVLVLAAALVVATPGAGSAFQIQQNLVVSDNPVNFTPNILSGKVEAIVQVGGRIIAAGQFTQARNAGSNTTLTRNNILSFNATTGVIDTTFTPNVNGEITSMVVAPGGTDIIIGGAFTSIGGVTKQRVARLNATTGAVVTTFTANASGKVNDLTLWGSRVVLGGAFATVNGTSRPRLVAVSATTGALDAALNLTVTGTFNGGTTNIQKLDVSPNGTRLVFVGNFTAVGGQSRVQIAMVDLSTPLATVANWQTSTFSGACASAFNTYMRDVEFSPDGAYFVPVTTGAGYFPTTLCDTATRWETSATGSNLQPTWVDYSGGDTYTAVAITGTTIYVGGHMRWLNNGIVGDVAAAGAVSREGIGALDPQNGMPLRWNPTRARGVGVFAFLATPQGLWVGHDTQTLGHETHNRIGMFPLAGGTSVPVGQEATLPATLSSAPATACAAQDARYLYRIDAGGPGAQATDCGIDWAADDGATNPAVRNAGSNVAAWGSNGSPGPTVPASTPGSVFATERWDPGDGEEMQWHFAVPAGRNVQVRLYLMNQYDGTSQVGQRVFDVAVEGTTVLDDYDIVADVGHLVGVMKPFDVVSDGTITVDFGHVVENPLLSAIEIVDLDAAPGPLPGSTEYLTRRSFDGTVLGPDAVLATPGTDWSQARGTFFLNGRVYAGWSDGRLYAWPFDGSTLGARADLLAQGGYSLGPTWISFSDVTGMFWTGGRLYYTRAGDASLHYRYFTLESGLVGSVEYTVSGPGMGGLDWSGVRGMTQAAGSLYWATEDGVLHRIAFVNGAPVPGTSVVIGGPAIDGRDWQANGLFLGP